MENAMIQSGGALASGTHELSSELHHKYTPGDLAFFLDLDGTLAPIAPTPDLAAVPAATIALLRHISQASSGATAIVSGRDTPDIKRMLAPLDLPYAALHGAVIKDAAGRTEAAPVSAGALNAITAGIEEKTNEMPGIILERKALSLALHYRNAPQFESALRQLAHDVLTPYLHEFNIQEGKMVVEIKPRGVSKGKAIEHFMGTAPFRDRVPLMAGDDLTDESAFIAVNAMGGISVKIGPGPTQANWRLESPAALYTWLLSL